MYNKCSIYKIYLKLYSYINVIINEKKNITIAIYIFHNTIKQLFGN